MYELDLSEFDGSSTVLANLSWTSLTCAAGVGDR